MSLAILVVGRGNRRWKWDGEGGEGGFREARLMDDSNCTESDDYECVGVLEV